MQKIIAILGLLAASGAGADETVAGRFHLEVLQTEGYRFQVTATPTGNVTPMQPVNEAGLHLSCLLIPDLMSVTLEEADAAISVAADRYCQRQFGNDHFSSTEGAAPVATGGPAYAAAGTCLQAPM